MRYRLRKIRKPQIFVLLMVGSAALVMLPRQYTSPLRNLVHLVAYVPQLTATRTVQTVGGEMRDLAAPPVAADQHDKVVRENLTLSAENVALRGQVAELNATLQSLSGLRKRGLREGVLVPASVIALDAAGARETLCLGKGRLSNINRGDWVASHLFIQAGSNDGVQDQAAILAHEYLIGWVEEVCPITSRVVLLSDPVASRNMSVRVVPPRGTNRPEIWQDGKPVSFPLEGAGNGRMRMLDIYRDYVEKKQLVEGDWVFCQTSPRLPIPLVIGKIEQFEHVRTKPVYYRATVVPVIAPKSLEQVFVLDLSRKAAASGQRFRK